MREVKQVQFTELIRSADHAFMESAPKFYSYNYCNLTNGVSCPRGPAFDGYVRIGSTSCEQKRWGDVIRQAGVDILIRLAWGDSIILHDQSEHARMTRAQWQGLSWIRYACARSWRLTVLPEYTRGGLIEVTDYWDRCYRRLNQKDRRYLAYFRRFVNDERPDRVVHLWPCDCKRVRAVEGEGREHERLEWLGARPDGPATWLE